MFLHVPPDVAGYGVWNRFLPISDDRWWRMVEDVFAWGWSVTSWSCWRASPPLDAVESTGSTDAVTGVVRGGGAGAAVTYEYVIGWNAEIPAVAGVRIYYVTGWARAAVAVALAAGLVRLRRTRSAVVDLVAELGHEHRPLD